ncbi:MAG: hypothetical protein JWQ35_248 [Bacteriovoracaceae bacterium]|nr:hypothetical protein [Bacteriovoracaceae bacterium]
MMFSNKQKTSSFLLLALLTMTSGCSYLGTGGSSDNPSKKFDELKISTEGIPQTGFWIFKKTALFLQTSISSSESWEAESTVRLDVCIKSSLAARWKEFPPEFLVGLTKNQSDEPSWISIQPKLEEDCLNLIWNEPVKFPYAATDTRPRKYFVHIKGASPELKDVERVEAFSLDFWHQTIYATKAETDTAAVSPAVDSVQLSVDQILQSKILSHEIYIEPPLRAMLRLHYFFALRPDLIRPSSLNTPFSLRNWTHSQFRIIAALVLPSVDADSNDIHKYRFLAGFQSEVFTDSTGNLPIEGCFNLPLEKYPDLNSKVRLIVDIIPLSKTIFNPEATSLVLTFGEHSNILGKSIISAAEYINRSDKNTIETIQLNKTTTQIYSLGSTSNGQPLNQFLKKRTPLDLKMFDLDKIHGQLQDLDIAAEDLTPLIKEHGDGHQSRLSLEALLQKMKPWDFVRVTRFHFVDSIESIPISVEMLPPENLSHEEVLEREKTDQTSRVTSTQNSGSYEVSVPKSIGLEGGSGVSKQLRDSVEKRITKQSNQTEATETKTENRLDHFSNFYVYQFDLGLKATQRACLLIELQKYQWNLAQPSRAYLFCLQDSGELIESWRYLSDERLPNLYAVLDSKLSSEHQLGKVIRGTHKFQNFINRLNGIILSPEPASFERILADNLNKETEDEGILFPRDLTPEAHYFDEEVSALTGKIYPADETKAKKLAAYFHEIQSNPHRMLATAQGQRIFEDISKILVARNDHYFKLLQLLNFWLPQATEYAWFRTFVNSIHSGENSP